MSLPMKWYSSAVESLPQNASKSSSGVRSHRFLKLAM
ncbi:hypothetical protein PFLmoz3_03400 [Pseudomonas fluorescens]|uniref:Uncharacterized protein n=1 Tax=Pseudomonas fluorescens TaxID=294 RepID=A0A109LG50_PSEFL|nr:hypothetical protein PFLmoz3_03400 [Pseudomonas fluorescens]